MNFDDSTPLVLVSDRNLIAAEFSSVGDYSTLIPVEAGRGEILELSNQEEQERQSALLSPEARLEPLSPEEQRERERLEWKIRQTCSDAYYRLGEALNQIRKKPHLYLSTHKNFKHYCQDEFGYSRRHADNLIQFAYVTDNLESMRAIHSQNQPRINPTNLEQSKALGKLKTAEEQWQIWNKAIEAANGKAPSGRIVNQIVAHHKQENIPQGQRKPLELAQDDCQVDDVFTLVRLEGKDKKYNRCLATVTEFADATVTVNVYNATITVKLENLKKIASPDDKPKLLQTLKRARRIREKVELLDPTAEEFLKKRSKQTKLTNFEERFLSFLEDFYGVDKQEE